MTPQEKAIELVTKYRRHLPINTVTDLEAKGCALMAVDEITRELMYHQKHPDIKDTVIKINIYQALQYWKAVEQEIEKL